MKPDYTELDAAILQAIREGCRSFGAIQDARCTRDEQGKCRDFRTLDRRLQALRRAGDIAHRAGSLAIASNGWRLVSREA